MLSFKYLSIKSDGTVTTTYYHSQDKSSYVRGGILFFVESGEGVETYDCDGFSATRKGNAVQVNLKSSLQKSAVMNLGTLPESMRPPCDIIVPINYGEDSGYPAHFAGKVSCYYQGCNYTSKPGDMSLLEKNTIYTGNGKYGRFVVSLSQKLAYDLKLTLTHSNAEPITNKDKNDQYFIAKAASHPLTIEAGETIGIIEVSSYFSKTGRLYLSAEAEGVGTKFEQLLLLELNVISG